MEFITLNNGVKMPAEGIGTFLLTPDEAETAVLSALKDGARLIDTANAYCNEKAVGRAMKKSGLQREEIFLETKLWPSFYEQPDAVDKTLARLDTPYIDLLLIHRPDPLMDADEVADAFKHLHQSGKVRHFGVSNFTPAQFALLQSRLPFTLATNQVEISPVHQPLLLDGTLDQLQQLRIRPMAWSCLGGGRLFNDDYFQPLRDELAVVAEELNAGSIEQVVYAWVLRLPSQPLPIIGSGKIERVRAAVEAETLKMTRQQWFRIRKAALGYDVP